MTSDTETKEGSSLPQMQQTTLADIFTAFSEINTILEEQIKDYQRIIDDYTNGRTTANVTTNNLLKLSESLADTRSKAFALYSPNKYADDKNQFIRACDSLDQSLKYMKTSVNLRNTNFYNKSQQELHDAIRIKELAWENLNKDLQDDGYTAPK